MAWFARGLGAAREGRSQDARAVSDRFRVLGTATSDAGEALFARNVRILRLEVSGWLAHAEGDTQYSVGLLREAAELEVATPKHAVTPGPTLPSYELLGDLLLEQAHPAEALVAYRHSLELYPRRFNSLLGAARAAPAAGDESVARTFYQELLQLAAETTGRPALDDARTFVSRPR